jgi:hypothetical protein
MRARCSPNTSQGSPVKRERSVVTLGKTVTITVTVVDAVYCRSFYFNSLGR